MAFHDVRFPTGISYGSSGGPEFSTEVVVLASGQEQRNANWERPREKWNVAFGVKRLEDVQALTTFFYARQGKAHSFRFKNHDDYQATGQALGDGDGLTVDFQLVKQYTSGPTTFSRSITKPISGTVTIYLDDGGSAGPVALVENTHYTVDYDTGIITMASAPNSGEVLTADFDFDIHVRFDTDHLPANLETYKARSADVPIVELKS